MISFALPDEDYALQETCRKFAKDHLRPAARDAERTGTVPENCAKEFWQLGLGAVNPCLGREHGGLDYRGTVVVEEELAFGDPAINAALPRCGEYGELLARSGQAQRIKALLQNGPIYTSAALLLRRPGGRPSCRAETRNGQYVLTGSLPLVLNASASSVLALVAELDGQPAVFTIDPSAVKGSTSCTLGLTAAAPATIQLDDYRIFANALLARGEQAVKAWKNTVRASALVWSARAVGTMRAAFEYASRYSVQRSAFGKPIAEYQAIAFMIADMGIFTDAARALTWRAAWHMDVASESTDAVTVAAEFATTALTRVTSDAVQVLGGHGYIQDHPVEKWMRDGRAIANILIELLQQLK